jgi:3-methyladenine DNA glycosylase AlkD
VKHKSQFFGTPMADIRKLMKVFFLEFLAFTDDEQKSFLEDAFSSDYAEHKLLGILILEQLEISENLLMSIKSYFKKGWISDWNICDWMCVKVLYRYHQEEEFSKLIDHWVNDETIWLSRASLVSYVNTDIEGNKKSIIALSKVLVLRSERFCKTAVGWLLRDLAKYDQVLVLNFVKENGHSITREVFNNIFKHLDSNLKSDYKEYLG